uniref:Uncharacterized protein n=1 Tax=Inoviridae sp. ctDEu7 TaxID=2826759 RepID=A0A8S5MTY3_9VIRU|nr:MAG TPA: hypothetical protein [Inoviridae sp. ctDEu7]
MTTPNPLYIVILLQHFNHIFKLLTTIKWNCFICKKTDPYLKQGSDKFSIFLSF